MVTAAMKLKNACSLKKSYDQPRKHIKKQRENKQTNKKNRDIPLWQKSI